MKNEIVEKLSSKDAKRAERVRKAAAPITNNGGAVVLIDRESGAGAFFGPKKDRHDGPGDYLIELAMASAALVSTIMLMLDQQTERYALPGHEGDAADGMLKFVNAHLRAAESPYAIARSDAVHQAEGR